MAVAGPASLCLLLTLLLFAAAHASEADVLLKFKAAISDPTGTLETWSAANGSPCMHNNTRWAGVICDNATVLGLQLENGSLSGTLDLDVLTALPNLRTLSFMNNSFKGPMPEVRSLGSLKSAYFSRNRFSGTIPDDAFTGMGSLKKLHLSQNEFSGPIPTSLAKLPRLMEVMLDGNNFDGAVPDLRMKSLQLVNLSNNALEGNIPPSLGKMDADLFAGNKGLCGAPLNVQCNTSSSPQQLPLSLPLPLPLPMPPPRKHSTFGFIASVAIAIGVTLAIVVALLATRRTSQVHEEQLGRPPSSKRPIKGGLSEGNLESGPNEHVGTAAGKKAARDHDQGRLVFVREDTERFELPDLLKSSAEVMGAGHLGCSYKATLMNGPSMVVKRLRDMNRVGKEDFEEHMRRMGRLLHPNLLPLVAYYYRKEEKLLVTEYAAHRSLADQLYSGDRGTKNPTLDWPTRLKIVKGVARGLAYLYDELSMLTVPHGHLRSSNVLLNESFEPLLADYALTPVMNQSHAAQYMAAYKSPEYNQFGQTSKKSDVWSLGLLILEILTGKHPANDSSQGKPGGCDLVDWIKSVDEREWCEQVFDSELKETKNGEGEMVKLMKIALACCEGNVDKRWEIKEAVDKIEELREIEENGVDFASVANNSEI
ncbi:pollen receptor-like kinase 4 [Typha angustifolia]|uniref:pollen receptor-like kinase 4 n=1 Tax=Typha angustifolia TaxID=59011 RepID=UPI003C2DAAD6